MQTIVGTDINRVKQLLESGELAAIPTETVYGLAANALDARAVANIFEVKNRPHFDPLIIHARSVEAINHYVRDLPEWARKLASKFMPGPLTLVLKKKDIIPDIVTAGLDTVGIRIPDHPMMLELLGKLDFPLAAPSANPFGYVSPTNARHVYDQLNQKIPYILDGGVCSIGIESTIIGEVEGKSVILRLGGTAPEDIWRVIGKCEIATHSTSNPINPGSLEHHYAPRHRLKFASMNFSEFDPKEIGIISFKTAYPEIPQDHQHVLSPAGDLREAAQKIFSAMRALDGMDISIIFAERFPDVGLGLAINDRLRRAST